MLWANIRIDTVPAKRNALYKLMSSYQIKIENINADLKDWRAVKDTLRIPLHRKEDLLDVHHKQYMVVGTFLLLQ